jgi:hypothetical protein
MLQSAGLYRISEMKDYEKLSQRALVQYNQPTGIY